MSDFFEWVHTAARRLALLGGYVAALALLAMSLGVTVDVAARYLLGASTQMAVEVSGYLLVATVFLALGYTQLNNAHIRIDLFLNMLPLGAAKAVSIVNSILFLAYCVILTVLGFKSVLTSYRFGTTSRTNLDVIVWPIQLIIPIGLLILMLLLLFEPARILKSRSVRQTLPPEQLHE